MCLKFIYTSNTKICWNINLNFHQGDFWRFHITLKVSYNFTTMDILADLKRKKKNGKKPPTNQPRFICPFCLGRSNNICNLSSCLKWGFDELPERWAEDQSQLLSSDPDHQSHGSIPEKVSCYPTGMLHLLGVTPRWQIQVICTDVKESTWRINPWEANESFWKPQYCLFSSS